MQIYLDNAATSWPKPEAVYQAVDQATRTMRGGAGRGGYEAVMAADAMIRQVRERVAKLVNAEEGKRIVFTAGGSDSLNLALHGFLKSGDHVVTTVTEHNSVLRPLNWLAENCGVTASYVNCNAAGYVTPAEIAAAIRPETRLVMVNHASNVTGAVQPIAEIGQICQQHGIRFAVDAAQSLGHMPIDVQAAGIHLLAAPGHKGLLGLLGVGLLYVAPGIEAELNPTRQGGTGTTSESESQPATMPERYECGMLNTPALAGLNAALALREDEVSDTWQANLDAMTTRLIAGIESMAGVRLIGPAATANRVGVVSVTVEGYDPQEVAMLLSQLAEIECRAGLHCAARMHKSLDTFDGGGTVRFSPGYATTAAEIDTTLEQLSTIAGIS